MKSKLIITLLFIFQIGYAQGGELTCASRIWGMSAMMKFQSQENFAKAHSITDLHWERQLLQTAFSNFGVTPETSFSVLRSEFEMNCNPSIICSLGLGRILGRSIRLGMLKMNEKLRYSSAVHLQKELSVQAENKLMNEIDNVTEACGYGRW